MNRYINKNTKSNSLKYGDIIYLQFQDTDCLKYLICTSSLKGSTRAISEEFLEKDINFYRCLFTIVPSTTNYAKTIARTRLEKVKKIYQP